VSRITFPASPSLSSNVNTLDDYEEGTWTPTLIAFSGGTNATISYGQQLGRYTKIGNTVFLEFYVSINSKAGGSGIVCIGNLPFTPEGSMQYSGTLTPYTDFTVSVTNPSVYVAYSGSFGALALFTEFGLAGGGGYSSQWSAIGQNFSAGGFTTFQTSS
jgi:hypothetical protein